MAVYVEVEDVVDLVVEFYGIGVLKISIFVTSSAE